MSRISRSKNVSLLLVDEPDPRQQTVSPSFQHLIVTYADGPRDCEAVAVDPTRRRILLLSKSNVLASLHQVPLPPRRATSDDADGAAVSRATAQPVTSVALPLATGMDRDPAGGDFWISTYWQAYRFAAAESDSLADVFRRLPQSVDLPKLKQIEAIAADSRGRLWVTSEGQPAFLQRVNFRP